MTMNRFLSKPPRPRPLSARSRSVWLAALALLAIWGAARIGHASIRMDGSEFQGSSNVATTTSVTKAGNEKAQSLAVFPTKIVLTLGQPVMALGVLPSAEPSRSVFKIGLGYEYNVWGTADLQCECLCFGDPVCDGSPTDLADVVATIAVAMRGVHPTQEGNCPIVTTDVDCDGLTNILDVVKMINVAFRGEPESSEFCNPCP